MSNHPNVSVIKGDISCPKCGGLNLRPRSVRYTNAGAYKRYSCNDCGGWARGRTMEKGAVRTLTNA